VAHRARLIFGGLIVGRSRGSLNGKCVTLQAQQVHLAHPQVTWIGRSVGRVTTAAALSLHRYMFVNERALFVGVALDTNRIPAGHSPHLPEGGSAMDVMAVAALDQAFVYSMVIGLREVGLRGCMTSVAEAGLCPNEEMLRFLGVVRRVAIQAPNIVARVRRRGEVPLFMFCTVAGQAKGIGILFRHRLETNDLAHIAAALYVRGSGTVTGLTTVSVVQGGLEMRCVFEVLFVKVFMTGFADVHSDILVCLLLGGGGRCFPAGRLGLVGKHRTARLPPLSTPGTVCIFRLPSRSDSSCRDKRRGIPFSNTGYSDSACRFDLDQVQPT